MIFEKTKIIHQPKLGGGFKCVFMFTPKPGEDSHFDEHIFGMGWFKHQLEKGLESHSMN